MQNMLDLVIADDKICKFLNVEIVFCSILMVILGRMKRNMWSDWDVWMWFSVF